MFPKSSAQRAVWLVYWEGFCAEVKVWTQMTYLRYSMQETKDLCHQGSGHQASPVSSLSSSLYPIRGDFQILLLSLYPSLQGQFNTCICRLFSRQGASFISESSFRFDVTYCHSFCHGPLLITLGSVCLEFFLSYFTCMVYNDSFPGFIANP